MLKNVDRNAIVCSLENFIAFNLEKSDNPFFTVRAKKGTEILSIVKKEEGNQGFHDDMVEAIFTIYQECQRGVYGNVIDKNGLSFTDTFYYIYHILVNETRMEDKIKKYVPIIFDIYKKAPEKSMKVVLNQILKLKEDNSEQNNKDIEECKKLLLFLFKLI